jgi:sec-independent protein translocase protein TatA
MPSIGPLEIGLILVIVLVVFGPKRLPDLGRSLGSGMREFKDSITGGSKDDDDDEPSKLTAAKADEPEVRTAPKVEEPDDAVSRPRS